MQRARHRPDVTARQRRPGERAVRDRGRDGVDGRGAELDPRRRAEVEASQPLDERGGRGISILKLKLPLNKKMKQIQSLSGKEQLPIMAQEFISKRSLRADKRIFLLEGKFLAAYERRFAKGDFRGNLSQGATHHQTHHRKKKKKYLTNP